MGSQRSARSISFCSIQAELGQPLVSVRAARIRHHALATAAAHLRPLLERLGTSAWFDPAPSAKASDLPINDQALAQFLARACTAHIVWERLVAHRTFFHLRPTELWPLLRSATILDPTLARRRNKTRNRKAVAGLGHCAHRRRIDAAKFQPCGSARETIKTSPFIRMPLSFSKTRSACSATTSTSKCFW